MPEQTPLVKTFTANVPAAGAAVASDQALGTAPFDGTVTGVRYTPEAGMVGAATNFRTLRVLNRGQSGAGSTVVASLAFSAPAVTATAFDEKEITLSGVGGATTVAQGDVLVWDETVAGTGLASPGGSVAVDVSRSA